MHLLSFANLFISAFIRPAVLFKAGKYLILQFDESFECQYKEFVLFNHLYRFHTFEYFDQATFKAPLQGLR